jgi:hypothetical protein
MHDSPAYSSTLPRRRRFAKLRLSLSPMLLGILRMLTVLCIFLKPFFGAAPGRAVTGLTSLLSAAFSLLGSLTRRSVGGVGGGLLGAAKRQLSVVSMLPAPLIWIEAEWALCVEKVGLVLLTQHGQEGTPVVGRAHIVVGETTDSSKMGAGVSEGAHMGAVGSEGRKLKMEARLPGLFHIGAEGLGFDSAKRRWRKYLGAILLLGGE